MWGNLEDCESELCLLYGGGRQKFKGRNEVWTNKNEWRGFVLNSLCDDRILLMERRKKR